MYLQRTNLSLPTRGSYMGCEVRMQELYYYNFPIGHHYFSNAEWPFLVLLLSLPKQFKATGKTTFVFILQKDPHGGVTEVGLLLPA